MKKIKKKIIRDDIVLPEINPAYNTDLDIEIDALPEDEYDFIPDEFDSVKNDFNVEPPPGEKP